MYFLKRAWIFMSKGFFFYFAYGLLIGLMNSDSIKMNGVLDIGELLEAGIVWGIFGAIMGLIIMAIFRFQPFYLHNHILPKQNFGFNRENRVRLKTMAEASAILQICILAIIYGFLLNKFFFPCQEKNVMIATVVATVLATIPILPYSLNAIVKKRL